MTIRTLSGEEVLAYHRGREQGLAYRNVASEIVARYLKGGFADIELRVSESTIICCPCCGHERGVEGNLQSSFDLGFRDGICTMLEIRAEEENF